MILGWKVLAFNYYGQELTHLSCLPKCWWKLGTNLSCSSSPWGCRPRSSTHSAENCWTFEAMMVTTLTMAMRTSSLPTTSQSISAARNSGNTCTESKQAPLGSVLKWNVKFKTFQELGWDFSGTKITEELYHEVKVQKYWTTNLKFIVLWVFLSKPWPNVALLKHVILAPTWATFLNFTNCILSTVASYQFTQKISENTWATKF